MFTHRTLPTEKHRETFAQKKKYTHTHFFTNCTHRLHKKNYTPKFLHAETLPRTVFTQQKLFRTEAFTNIFFYCTAIFAEGFFTQKILRTKGFTHNIFYIQTFVYTKHAFTRKTNCTQNLCTQHTFTRNQFLHREVLFSLFDHLPFLFPLSNCIL